jgi:hypothetical protein
MTRRFGERELAVGWDLQSFAVFATRCSLCYCLRSLTLFATFVVTSAVFATVCSLCHCLQSLSLFAVFAIAAGPVDVASSDVGAASALLLSQFSLLRAMRSRLTIGVRTSLGFAAIRAQGFTAMRAQGFTDLN